MLNDGLTGMIRLKAGGSLMVEVGANRGPEGRVSFTIVEDSGATEVMPARVICTVCRNVAIYPATIVSALSGDT